ncbi:ribosome biogenesis protein [Candidatus Woesearchaeota archaeon]|nr:ribosome biogenesis protein [Candidatus Woesearchaeota archaeon]
MPSLLYCTKCKTYTMEKECKVCKSKTIEPKPPKYSPEDKFGDYRRQAKSSEYKEKGLL